MMEHHPSNLTLFDELGNDVSSDVYDHQHLARCLRVVFTVLAIMIGITGIVFNIGFVFSTIVDAQSRAELTLQTKQLIVSLAIADILLLIFGLPYDLVAANNYPWLEGRIGCQISAYLPEASRYVWMGTVILSFPDHWPAVMKRRTFSPAWSRLFLSLVWVVSLAVAVPFAVHVDCHNLSEPPLDYSSTPEENGSSPDDHTCSCVLTVNQTEVVLMFGSSLIAFTIIPVLTLGQYVWKSRRSANGQQVSADSHRTTCSKTLAAMLLAFMGCTLPRYVYIVVNYSELLSSTDTKYELVMTAAEIFCCCLFYASTLIHLTLSPHPRWLFSRLSPLCRRNSAARH